MIIVEPQQFIPYEFIFLALVSLLFYFIYRHPDSSLISKKKIIGHSNTNNYDTFIVPLENQFLNELYLSCLVRF